MRKAAALVLLLCCSVQAVPGAAVNIATPDPSVTARLVWASMVAIDNANRTGNYSVLRGIGSRTFQARNSEADLAEAFRPLRERRIDVGRAILMEPTFYIPPNVDSQGQLRLRGAFESRPVVLRFDLIFVFEDGGWRLLAVSVQEASAFAPR